MIKRLVLLPGMDGTGDLFADFVSALPDGFETGIVRYPTEIFLSYSELMPLVQSLAPASEPFVLVAESFSTPLALSLIHIFYPPVTAPVDFQIPKWEPGAPAETKVEETYPRILPPSTGEPVPAARPGSVAAPAEAGAEAHPAEMTPVSGPETEKANHA